MNWKNKEIDMLHGPLAGKLLLFTLPIAPSSMVQQLFNAADTAVVGYFGSEDALTAVGTNTENILIANHVGRNETKELPAAVQTACSWPFCSAWQGFFWGRQPQFRCCGCSKHRRIFLRKQRFTCGSICSAIRFYCCTISVRPR